jgi:Tfp pilus assembly protein PilO
VITATLIGLLSLACSMLALVIGRLFAQQEEMEQLRIHWQEERAWSDEYQRRLTTAQAELADLRREYATHQRLRNSADAAVYAAAWRRGLNL